MHTNNGSVVRVKTKVVSYVDGSFIDFFSFLLYLVRVTFVMNFSEQIDLLGRRVRK